MFAEKEKVLRNQSLLLLELLIRRTEQSLHRDRGKAKLMSQHEEQNCFRLPVRKHHKNQRHGRHKIRASCSTPGDQSDYYLQAKRCSIQKLLSILTMSQWAELAARTEKILISLIVPEACDSIHQIVVYGIGSFMTCSMARDQLALINAVRQRIGPTVPALVFDPVLQAQDYRLLQQHLHMDAIEENEACSRSIDKSTGRILFFMPHLDKQLYDNLLRANWQKGLLDRILILGNSFTNMADSQPARILMSECPHVFHSLQMRIVREQELRFTGDSLNDLSLHAFDCGTVTSEAMAATAETVGRRV